MTEPIKLESICPSCGKTDKLLWPEGCNNAWHREGEGVMSEIQRWDLEHDVSSGDDHVMVERADGEFLRYADHAAALRERDERIAALEMHRINATLAEKKDCERALVALAGAGICTPEETYGTNSSWAIADLCRAVAALRKQVDRLSAPVTDAVMEELAAMEHERWSSQAIAALTDMTDARRERWTRQARLLYVGLTDAEKEQDRQQVRKTLTILAARKGAA